MIHSLTEQLCCLRDLLYRLNDEQYTCRSSMLNHATIGQHVRHVIELGQCLILAYQTGVLNYDKRKRDERMENSRSFALQQLNDLFQSINKPEKKLQLQVATSQGTHTLETWFHREVFYNTEHAIHHMALIRVALKEMQLDIVNDNFGVAYATVQHRQTASA
ncbi:DinB family protein [Fulvivirgaceae bacterium PWU4]|uniref:DinB family protein n=1 Tax=Chryseosolibacter histidini TaxID=2782349 RepID=A0AAP2GS93_9BACT|nr:DinB family protein [Chryseosolibacter histidini]MBT1700447.1 DinB family protein [Chryseosolibacter histidini]